MTTLSKNAEKLLEAIKHAPLWEDQAICILFPYITYSKETALDVWQREANVYGYAVNRPVNGVSILITPSVEKCYADITMDSISELKRLNLIFSKNAGYNVYSYHYKGK